ncbi:tyrosine-type recombinase/integrase [Sandarakinorhabdus oryzae]|uniref:tyrosine-type recombinase/integrase n=1 Tax=Sandarakinorhabdus oryzae TaxID=2675220 RepID=UPI0012E1BD54|nr:site-specific integrase [Sandarakinorhabdus oryzae]
MGRSGRTALTVRHVETCTKVGYTADAKQPGLNLQVVEGACGYARSWVFRYTSPVTGKRREIGLGSVSLRGLAEAREKAGAFRKQVIDGLDPKDLRDAEKAQRAEVRPTALTFQQVAEQCIATRQHEWKNAKHRHQWAATLKTYAYPTLGALPVDQITMERVLAVLEPIWTTKTETATRLRQRIETVMDWAKARKLYTGDNPASLKGGLGQLLPKASKIAKVRHQPALPYQQIHAFVRELRQKRGISPKAFEFLILTAARSGEVLGAKWDEFDLNAKVWTIPAERMKAGREHRVPLSGRAMVIVRAMLAGKQGDFVFPNPSGKKALSNGALLAVIKGMPGYAEYVPHGFRSTFRDWAAETTSIANETLELALAHTIRDKAEAAYRRQDQLEKRVALMDRWARYVQTAPQAATVTAIGVRHG